MQNSIDIDPEIYPSIGSDNGHPTVNGVRTIARHDKAVNYVVKDGERMSVAIGGDYDRLYNAAKEKALLPPFGDEDYLWDRD
jgi:hypothetical protein